MRKFILPLLVLSGVSFISIQFARADDAAAPAADAKPAKKAHKSKKAKKAAAAAPAAAGDQKADAPAAAPAP